MSRSVRSSVSVNNIKSYEENLKKLEEKVDSYARRVYELENRSRLLENTLNSLVYHHNASIRQLSQKNIHIFNHFNRNLGQIFNTQNDALYQINFYKRKINQIESYLKNRSLFE